MSSNNKQFNNTAALDPAAAEFQNRVQLKGNPLLDTGSQHKDNALQPMSPQGNTKQRGSTGLSGHTSTKDRENPTDTKVPDSGNVAGRQVTNDTEISGYSPRQDRASHVSTAAAHTARPSTGVGTFDAGPASVTPSSSSQTPLYSDSLETSQYDKEVSPAHGPHAGADASTVSSSHPAEVAAAGATEVARAPSGSKKKKNKKKKASRTTAGGAETPTPAGPSSSTSVGHEPHFVHSTGHQHAVMPHVAKKAASHSGGDDSDDLALHHSPKLSDSAGLDAHDQPDKNSTATVSNATEDSHSTSSADESHHSISRGIATAAKAAVISLGAGAAGAVAIGLGAGAAGAAAIGAAGAAAIGLGASAAAASAARHNASQHDQPSQSSSSVTHQSDSPITHHDSFNVQEQDLAPEESSFTQPSTNDEISSTSFIPRRASVPSYDTSAQRGDLHHAQAALAKSLADSRHQHAPMRIETIHEPFRGLSATHSVSHKPHEHRHMEIETIHEPYRGTDELVQGGNIGSLSRTTSSASTAATKPQKRATWYGMEVPHKETKTPSRPKPFSFGFGYKDYKKAAAAAAAASTGAGAVGYSNSNRSKTDSAALAAKVPLPASPMPSRANSMVINQQSQAQVQPQHSGASSAVGHVSSAAVGSSLHSFSPSQDRPIHVEETYHAPGARSAGPSRNNSINSGNISHKPKGHYLTHAHSFNTKKPSTPKTLPSYIPANLRRSHVPPPSSAALRVPNIPSSASPSGPAPSQSSSQPGIVAPTPVHGSHNSAQTRALAATAVASGAGAGAIAAHHQSHSDHTGGVVPASNSDSAIPVRKTQSEHHSTAAALKRPKGGLSSYPEEESSYPGGEDLKFENPLNSHTGVIEEIQVDQNKLRPRHDAHPSATDKMEGGLDDSAVMLGGRNNTDKHVEHTKNESFSTASIVVPVAVGVAGTDAVAAALRRHHDRTAPNADARVSLPATDAVTQSLYTEPGDNSTGAVLKNPKVDLSLYPEEESSYSRGKEDVQEDPDYSDRPVGVTEEIQADEDRLGPRHDTHPSVRNQTKGGIGGLASNLGRNKGKNVQKDDQNNSFGAVPCAIVTGTGAVGVAAALRAASTEHDDDDLIRTKKSTPSVPLQTVRKNSLDDPTISSKDDLHSISAKEIEPVVLSDSGSSNVLMADKATTTHPTDDVLSYATVTQPVLVTSAKDINTTEKGTGTDRKEFHPISGTKAALTAATAAVAAGAATTAHKIKNAVKGRSDEPEEDIVVPESSSYTENVGESSGTRPLSSDAVIGTAVVRNRDHDPNSFTEGTQYVGVVPVAADASVLRGEDEEVIVVPSNNIIDVEPLDEDGEDGEQEDIEAEGSGKPKKTRKRLNLGAKLSSVAAPAAASIAASAAAYKQRQPAPLRPQLQVHESHIHKPTVPVVRHRLTLTEDDVEQLTVPVVGHILTLTEDDVEKPIVPTVSHVLTVTEDDVHKPIPKLLAPPMLRFTEDDVEKPDPSNASHPVIPYVAPKAVSTSAARVAGAPRPMIPAEPVKGKDIRLPTVALPAMRMPKMSKPKMPKRKKFKMPKFSAPKMPHVAMPTLSKKSKVAPEAKSTRPVISAPIDAVPLEAAAAIAPVVAAEEVGTHVVEPVETQPDHAPERTESPQPVIMEAPKDFIPAEPMHVQSMPAEVASPQDLESPIQVQSAPVEVPCVGTYVLESPKPQALETPKSHTLETPMDSAPVIMASPMPSAARTAREVRSKPEVDDYKIPFEPVIATAAAIPVVAAASTSHHNAPTIWVPTTPLAPTVAQVTGTPTPALVPPMKSAATEHVPEVKPPSPPPVPEPALATPATVPTASPNAMAPATPTADANNEKLVLIKKIRTTQHFYDSEDEEEEDLDEFGHRKDRDVSLYYSGIMSRNRGSSQENDRVDYNLENHTRPKGYQGQAMQPMNVYQMQAAQQQQQYPQYDQQNYQPQQDHQHSYEQQYQHQHQQQSLEQKQPMQIRGYNTQPRKAPF
ncbi:hypothetical protein EDD11_001957 [Mortierella claussenii]|nr:hypothetical protein EDD11_001957 [Mortierella claussenii]